MAKWKGIEVRLVLNLDPGRDGVTTGRPTNVVKYFERGREGGVVVTEEGYIGGDGYPYLILRRNGIPREDELKDLAEAIRLRAFNVSAE